MEKIYTVAEVKEYLKISESTIRRYIASGELKTQKLGRQHRITETFLDEFIEEQANKKAGE